MHASGMKDVSCFRDRMWLLCELLVAAVLRCINVRHKLPIAWQLNSSPHKGVL
jgi:hypothetical protein